MKKGSLKQKKWITLLLVLIFILSTIPNSMVYAAKPTKNDRISPTAPANLRATAVGASSVSLDWDPSTDNIGLAAYEVFMNNTSVGRTADTAYIVNNLTPATTYQFYIRALDSTGNASSPSNIISVTTVNATPTPTPVPTATPTPVPTATPTPVPTATPTPVPTATPTPVPTATPTPIPTATPTPVPTATPSPVPTVTPTPGPSKQVIGYYAAWAAYSGYTPDRIDAGKLTVINYAFANIGSDLKIALGYPDVDPANITKLNALKSTNPNLKTVIAVGGWSWSGRFSDAALTETSRTAFADSCVDFIVRYGFDGVDIDWEYPVSGGLSTNIRRPEDKQNFTLLLKKLREKLDARGQLDGKHYLLTFAGASGSWYVNNVELATLHQYVDYANIMTYDIHGTWDTYTDFNAPLYGNSDSSPQYKWSVDQSINAWLNAGFPKNKLVMGVPFYGYIFKAVANINHGLYQTYSGSASISYANIAANYLKDPTFIRYYHAESMVPWLFNGSTFITYEDEQSMTLKAQYIVNKGLAGAMIWELSQDPDRVLLSALYNGLK